MYIYVPYRLTPLLKVWRRTHTAVDLIRPTRFSPSRARNPFKPKLEHVIRPATCTGRYPDKIRVTSICIFLALLFRSFIVPRDRETRRERDSAEDQL